VLALAAVAVLAPAGAAQAASCAAPGAPGGEWPFYSGTLDGHRGQLAETSISTANVGELGVAWKKTTPDGGIIHSTPTVAGGCVFTGTDLGNVYALNADTGDVVWTRNVAESGGSNFAEGSGIVGAPAISEGRVIVPATAPTGGVLTALDQVTGAVIWQTVVDDDDGSGLDSSPVPFNGMIFQAFKGDESSTHSHPGFVFVDAATGAILKRTFNIPQADYDTGDYRGASIINTPSVDLENKLVFAGTGNPASTKQHPRTNALLKIDADPASPTFGEILASHRGTSDSYPVPQDVDSPVCQTDVQWPVGRYSCAQFDYNFLSSPAIWTNSAGRQLFGGVQKSGVFTAVYRDTMEQAFQIVIGPPCLACNLSSLAVDDKGIYVAVTGGNLYSLNRDTGLPQWVTPLTGSLRMNGLAVANGVLYSLNDGLGTLQAFDAATGVPSFAHPFAQDNQSPMHDVGNSSGVSVARNTVFATSQWNSSSTLFALKRGATGGGGGGGLPPLPDVGGGGALTNANIVTGAGAASYGYVTPAAVMSVGGKVTYTNADIVRHNVTASAKGADGKPLFQSTLAALGERVPVVGADKLKPGTYAFFCSPHPNMKGQLIVR
jgi:outer membrane protein assembly factor BamB